MSRAFVELAVFSAFCVFVAVVAHLSLRRYYTASFISAFGASFAFNYINYRYLSAQDYFWPPAVIGGFILTLLTALIIGLVIHPSRVTHARQRLWVTLVGVVIAITLPIPIWNAQFKGIDGFYLQGKCMDGHDGFLEICRGNHYETCPGHKVRSQEGILRQVGDKWEALREGEVVFSVQSVGNDQIEIVKTNTKYKTRKNRVRNPWRIWLPWIFPE